jgi:arginase
MNIRRARYPARPGSGPQAGEYDSGPVLPKKTAVKTATKTSRRAGAAKLAVRTQVDLFGVPMDLGGFRRGTDMGPSALRIAGLAEKLEQLGYPVKDSGDIRVESRETTRVGDAKAKYAREIARCCEQLRRKVRASVAKGRRPLVIGGDHSIAIGTVAGVAGHFRERGEPIGLIWVDAHGDMNSPETSPSGNVHGMPLGVLLGWGVPELVNLGGFAPKVRPEHTVLIGIRDLDEGEKELMKRSGALVFTMKEVDQFVMSEVARRALERVTYGTAGFHLSVDLDGIDPMVAPGVATAVNGGLNFRETHLLMELVADSRRMLSMEMVELNPVLDTRNRTAEFAVGLILSAFGRQIL